MKLIFLDIDGVLNCTEWFKKAKREGYEDRDEFHFSPELVKNLNHITNETEAKIVISSSWRYGKTVEQLQELFKKVGITGEVIDKTPVLGHDSCRGLEIKKWIDSQEGIQSHTFNSYVIIDDDSDMLYNQRFNFFITDNQFGLGYNYTYRIINFLNSVK